MRSKPLRQAVSLALDVLSEKGPITRRQVVDEVLKRTTTDHWSIDDESQARANFLMGEVAQQMSEAHSDKFLDDHDIRVPESLRPLFNKMPRFICVSPRGGRDAEHVTALSATVADWEANAQLKGQIAKATNAKRDEARAFLDFLRMNRVETLGEYLNKKGEKRL